MKMDKRTCLSMDVTFLLLFQLLASSTCLQDDSRLSRNTSASSDYRGRVSQLRKLLMMNYSNDLRPLLNHNEVMHVRVAFVLIAVSQLSMKTQVLKTNAWLATEWTDQLLQWEPSEHGNITELYFEKGDLWHPAIQVDNPIHKIVVGHLRMGAKLEHTGKVRFHLGIIMETMCPVKISKYPFDTQTCDITLLSWFYPTKEVIFHPIYKEVSLAHLIPNGEWNVGGTSAKAIRFAPNFRRSQQHSAVKHTLHLKRRSFFYIMNTVIPLILFSTLNMLVFVVPADCGERIVVAVSALLAFTIYLDIISEDIPQTSEHICILTVYLTSEMGLGTAVVMSAALILNIHYRSPKHEIPQSLLHIFTKLFTVEPEEDMEQNKIKKKLTGLDQKVNQMLKTDGGSTFSNKKGARFQDDQLPGGSKTNIANIGAKPVMRSQVSNFDVKDSAGTETQSHLPNVDDEIRGGAEKRNSLPKVDTEGSNGTDRKRHLSEGFDKLNLDSDKTLSNSDSSPDTESEEDMENFKKTVLFSSGGEPLKKGVPASMMRQFVTDVTQMVEQERDRQMYRDISWHDIGQGFDFCMFWVFFIATNTLTVTVLYLLLR